MIIKVGAKPIPKYRVYKTAIKLSNRIANDLIEKQLSFLNADIVDIEGLRKSVDESKESLEYFKHVFSRIDPYK